MLLLMLAAAISQAFGRVTLAILLPQMTADYIGNYGRAGIASAANLAGYIVSTLIVMIFGPRFESTKVLRYGLLITLTGIIVVAIGSSFPLLIVMQFVMGLGSGVVWLSCAPIAAAHAPPQQKGLAFGIMFAGVGVGIVLTGAITWVVQHVVAPDAWRAVWVVEFVIGAIVFALVTIYLKPIGVAGALVRGTRSPARLLATAVAWICVGYGFYGIAHGTYTTFLTAALHQDRGFSLGSAANLYSLMGVTNLSGGLLFGRASDRFGRRPPMIAACLLIVGCALVVPFGPLWLVTLSPLFYGVAMSGLPTVLTAHLSDIFEPVDLGISYGAITLAVGVGQLVAPPLGGWLADSSGSFTGTYEIAAASAFVAAAATLLYRRHPVVSTPQLLEG